jgi:pyruvate, water dikinase
LIWNVFLMQGQNYVSSISDYSTFQKLKGKPLSDKFSNIESVKVVFNISNNKLYFFNSSLIRLHFSFVSEYLGYDKGLDQFNQDNYSNTEKERDFLLGNLNHIKGSNKWVFELAASDHMPTSLIETFFTTVQSSTYIGKELKFYLNSREKVDFFNQGKFKIPCVTSDYIFNELNYQQVVSGTSVGILKSYTIKELDRIRPQPNEIIILDGTPDILPNVKAIIVNELQTPLSHLVILGKNRKIPIMAYTKVQKDWKLQNFLHKKVELKVQADTFFVHETSKKIVQKAILKKKKLVVDNSETSLVDLRSIPKKGVNCIGSKAMNLSYLIAISKDLSFKTPEIAYAVPFYYYTKHIQKKEIAPLIEALIQLPNNNRDEIALQLKKIRTAIKNEPVDSKLLQLLHLELGRQNDYKKFRFRSSTNAEDIEGFNGAGLYESETGIINDTIHSFEKAIQKVWASVWNESSYWERELFGIDQQSIAMGIVVHRSFPEEIANGVIITQNLYRENFSGITINIQKGDNPVVKPQKGAICEQFTVYDFNLFDTNESFDVD